MNNAQPDYITISMSETDIPHQYKMTIVYNYTDVESIILTPLEFYTNYGYESLMGMPFWGVKFFLTNKEFIQQISNDGKLEALQNWVTKTEHDVNQLSPDESEKSPKEPPHNLEQFTIGKQCLKTLPCQHRFSFFKEKHKEKFTFDSHSFYKRYGLDGLKKLPPEFLKHWLDYDLKLELARHNELEAVELFINSNPSTLAQP